MSLIEDAEPRLKEALKSFGWFKHRSVPINNWLSTLKNDESASPAVISEFPAVRAFLEEFGGLKMDLRNFPSKNQVFGIRSVEFDPVMAGVGEMSRVKAWIDALGVRAYPIEEIDGNQIVLTEDGAMYFDAEGDGMRLGTSIEEALMLLVFREKRADLLIPNLFFPDYK